MRTQTLQRIFSVFLLAILSLGCNKLEGKSAIAINGTSPEAYSKTLKMMRSALSHTKRRKLDEVIMSLVAASLKHDLAVHKKGGDATKTVRTKLDGLSADEIIKMGTKGHIAKVTPEKTRQGKKLSVEKKRMIFKEVWRAYLKNSERAKRSYPSFTDLAREKKQSTKRTKFRTKLDLNTNRQICGKFQLSAEQLVEILSLARSENWHQE